MEFIATPAAIPLGYRVQDAFQKGISEFDPWIGSAVASFERELPIPPSCGLFKSDGFFRLRRHARSMCYAPTGGEPIRSVFCIKGMEPLAPDFRSKLDRMAALHKDALNVLERLIIVEDKLPGCLLFNEARAEAEIAASVQARLAKDGEGIPRLPFPVICVRLPETTAESAVREIAARASRSLWTKIEMLAAAGLGAYVYWYPSLPLRVEHCVADKNLAVPMANGWISLAARMLRAGFLPTTAHSRDRGHCCNDGNSVVDGGFADLGSVVSVTDLRSRRDVFLALEMTIWTIATTILLVLGRKMPPVSQLDYVSHMAVQMVREQLAQACGNDVDPRLLQFFGATKTAGTLAQLLNHG